MPDDAVLSSLTALNLYFVGDASVSDTLRRICDAVLTAVPPAAFAGISMTVDAQIGTYVFTHPEVEKVDQAQYDTGDGPCIDAFRTGEVVTIHDTAAAGPYPEFRTAALEQGMHSVLSLPMTAEGQVVGAMNLYSPRPDAFRVRDVETGRTFARHAAYLLLNHQAYWDALSLSDNLRQAMDSRAEIEQAKGIIMATTGCTADEAFERLKEQSQHQNVKLRDVARGIVRRTHPGPGRAPRPGGRGGGGERGTRRGRGRLVRP